MNKLFLKLKKLESKIRSSPVMLFGSCLFSFVTMWLKCCCG